MGTTCLFCFTPPTPTPLTFSSSASYPRGGALRMGSLQIILLQSPYEIIRASHMAPVVKNLPAKARDIRDTGSIPELGRSPGRGHGNPFQNSCLENPMDRGDWQATVHGVTKSWTRLKQLSTYAHEIIKTSLSFPHFFLPHLLSLVPS